uniref:Ankyrin repeat and sterile alpha motif domain-containing protein 1B n=1 Tax=Acrobeloides nanus TaxID=290746 RepID=A0A914C0C9_9BILA
MGGKDFNQSIQEFFENCRKGNQEKVNAWIQSRNRKAKSPLNFLRPTTPNSGWLSNIRDPCNSYTALHLASLNGHLEVVKTLLEHDPQLIGAKDRRGCLPIHLAAWNGHHLVVQHFLTIDPTLVDATNNAKECPLHLAAQHGHARVVSVLLQKHAGARLRNARYETPLDIAARTGKENVCRLLICHCPELALQSAAECSTADNRTISSHVVYPLHSAARHGHLECAEVLCHAGFDVNYVTEEGTALHVAALFGRLEVVKLLLDSGVDVNIKDSQGKTVLDKLKEHENQKASDITQVIQSREGWSACREAIEAFLKEYPNGVKPSDHIFPQSYQNFSQTSQPNSRDIVWRTIPENSLAIRNSPKSQHRQSSGSYASNGIYHPPSMTVDHVILEQPLFECDQASTISLSTTLHSDFNNTLERSCIETESGGSSVSPSIASTSSQRQTPKFPITSPNTKNRHVSSRRFVEHPAASQSISNPITSSKHDVQNGGCSYQAPPLYDSWAAALQAQQNPYSNIVDVNPKIPLSYDNVPRNLLVYDNAPPIGHRRWGHNCLNHAHSSIGVGNGKNVANNVREDGTQTVPVNSGPPKRPSILPDTFKKPTEEKLISSCSPKPSKHDIIRESIAEELDTFLPYEKFAGSRSSAVTFSFSTLERSISPERRISQIPSGSHAPLALPEEISGSTCTSLMSMSPDRHLHHNENRMRRSASSDNRTIRSSTTVCENPLSKSMHPMASNHSVELINEHIKPQDTSPVGHSNDMKKTASSLVSPDMSDCTADSSCSLPFAISQISSSPSSVMSPSKPNEEDLLSDKEAPPPIPLRAHKVAQNNRATTSKHNLEGSSTRESNEDLEFNQSQEWKKIEDILSAIRRDSLFAESNGSPVAISVRNRKSQALTLQLSSANLVKDEACSSNSDIISTDGDSGNDHAESLSVTGWLQQAVGLPKARSIEIAKIIEKNGFDRIEFMKGTLHKRTMTEIGIDKSIQHQILPSVERMRCLIPSIEDFEYTSDWLNALALMDYLGSFVNQNLTQPKSVLTAKLTIKDLKKMGITLIGHLERIQFSLSLTKNERSSLATLSTTGSHKKSASTLCNSSQQTEGRMAAAETSDDTNWAQKTAMLLHKCLSYSAHYLGAVEISNVEGAEDCRRAISASKNRVRQIIKVPQVILEISVGGVNVLDAASHQLIAQHEVNHIQVVCQDEWDLNCFAYIFQDGDKNICHVYCVLTADMAKDIIMTLGHAFNLAYNLALDASTG